MATETREISTTVTLTATQLDGLAYALELAAQDKERYFDDADVKLDYSVEDLRERIAVEFLNCTTAAAALGYLGLADRFMALRVHALAIADEIQASARALVG